MTKTIKGFTLIELLTVISIIGIVSSFGYPGLYDFLEKQRSITRTYELYRYLNYARSEAITKNRVISLCASENEQQCKATQDWSNKSVLIFVDNNQNGKIDNDDIIVMTKNFGMQPGSLMWRSFRNKSYLQWLPTGTTYYQNGNFTYCPPSKNTRHARNIIMNAVGRMYFGADNNNDGIVEGSNGKNISC